MKNFLRLSYLYFDTKEVFCDIDSFASYVSGKIQFEFIISSRLVEFRANFFRLHRHECGKIEELSRKSNCKPTSEINYPRHGLFFAPAIDAKGHLIRKNP